jgi:hypothetical protein
MASWPVRSKAAASRADLHRPEQTELDDGYLSASEVAALKLDADWVILSACNTAAGGTQGAEALSGLARAFFYAGARALLVSHWSVDSAATVKLITSAVGAITGDAKLGRAEALRRAMLAMIDDAAAPKLAHPAFWAPFIVVGEAFYDRVVSVAFPRTRAAVLSGGWDRDALRRCGMWPSGGLLRTFAGHSVRNTAALSPDGSGEWIPGSWDRGAESCGEDLRPVAPCCTPSRSILISHGRWPVSPGRAAGGVGAARTRRSNCGMQPVAPSCAPSRSILMRSGRGLLTGQAGAVKQLGQDARCGMRPAAPCCAPSRDILIRSISGVSPTGGRCCRAAMTVARAVDAASGLPVAPSGPWATSPQWRSRPITRCRAVTTRRACWDAGPARPRVRPGDWSVSVLAGRRRVLQATVNTSSWDGGAPPTRTSQATLVTSLSGILARWRACAVRQFGRL